MSKETSISQKDDGSWVLVNGNSESEESWADYEEAKEAMIADNELQTEADNTNNPDLYHDNCQITWIA